MKTNNKYIVDYSTMKQAHVEVGSLWDYNQALDNASNTKRLKVKAIHNGKMVEFEQEMPFSGYSIEYFDGRIFKKSKI